MVNLRKLKLKNKTSCECGHQFVANDITALIKNTDYQFYGGRVGYYSEAKCPKCNKDIVLLLEAYNNSYRVIDIGITEEIQENASDNIKIPEENQKMFQCAKCKREFKTPQALIAHQRSCLKK